MGIAQKGLLWYKDSDVNLVLAPVRPIGLMWMKVLPYE